MIGRSNIVGKPMALLLLGENCTVTVAHSRTRDLPKVVRRADIRRRRCRPPEMVRGDWLKTGATVIDVGINRTDGRCLDIIDRFGKVSAGQLAIESGLTTGAVTAVIDRLEGAGYVRRVRDPVDRRKIWVELTDEMRGITQRIFGFYMRGGGRMMERFTAGELDAIMRFLGIGAFLNTEMAAALREHQDADGLADAMRQHRRSTDHLIGVLGIHAESDGEVHGLVKFGERRLLHELAGLGDRVEALAIDGADRFFSLSTRFHTSS